MATGGAGARQHATADTLVPTPSPNPQTDPANLPPPHPRMQVQGVLVDWPVDRQSAGWLASRLLGWLVGLLAVLPKSQPGEAVIF